MSNAVLVTGGAGYIGSHVSKALAKEGFQPIVLDNLSMGHEWAVKWGPLVKASIGDREALRALISEHKPVGVIHLAAKAYVGESVQVPDVYWDNNVRQLTILLEELNLGGVRAMVFSSSCSIYGTPPVVPVPEDSPFAPISPYAQSKLFGEWAIRSFGRAFDFRYALLRYFNASGCDPDGEIGEDHDPETHLIPNALKAAMNGGSLSVFGTDYNTPDGTCIRDYVHVTDLADAHVKALQKLLAGQDVIANLGSGTGHTVLEVAATIERVTGKKLHLDMAPRREGDAEALFAARGRAQEVLGWVPQYQDLQTIVETAYRWEVAHFG